MTRALFCRACGEKTQAKPLDPEDRAQGWKIRHRYVALPNKPPAGHGIAVNGVFHPMEEICCDICCAPINGTTAIARTMWLKDREQQPRFWEEEYGTILTPDVVAAADKLAGNEPTKGQP